jgi:hypothetical protein
MIGNGQHRQSLIADLLPLLLAGPGQCRLEELVLQQDNREHDVLQGVLVSIQLAQNRTEIQMSIGEGLRLVDFELQLQSLDEIGQRSPDLPRTPIVTGQVIECG